jgi:hypothetical protein
MNEIGCVGAWIGMCCNSIANFSQADSERIERQRSMIRIEKIFPLLERRVVTLGNQDASFFIYACAASQEKIPV